VIRIGRIYGGPELTGSRIDQAIGRLAVLRNEYQTDALPALAVEFHVPGSILTPEHSGVRTGTLSKRRQLLMLQIAVPSEVLEAEQEVIHAFLLGSLREAVRLAGERFRRAKIPYDEQRHLAMIEKIAGRLVH
jgi:hypothetical protein